MVGQALETYRQLQQQSAQCDLSIEKHLATLAARTSPKPTASPRVSSAGSETASKASKRRKTPTAQEVSLASHLKRILGVDLTAIPGLNVLAVLSLLERDRHRPEQVAP